jgi:CheY-like chemotaxis protein
MPIYSLVLLVGDNPEDVDLIHRACQESGIAKAIHVVQDGAEAMDYLCGAGIYVDRRQYPLPSLVLLDLNVPSGSGLEALQWIRKQPGLELMRVVILTSSRDAADRERASELRAGAYLSKPGTFEQMVTLMSSLTSIGRD